MASQSRRNLDVQVTANEDLCFMLLFYISIYSVEDLFVPQPFPCFAKNEVNIMKYLKQM